MQAGDYGKYVSYGQVQLRQYLKIANIHPCQEWVQEMSG
jgi:hypothetical protein